MATHDFDAIINIVNDRSGDSVYFNGNSRLHITAADGAGFEYEYKKKSNGLYPVKYEAEGYNFEVDGLELKDFDVKIEFGWVRVDGGDKTTLMVLSFEKYDINDEEEEVIIAVRLDGKSLPKVNNAKQFDDLEDRITHQGGYSSGDYRPGQVIEWSEFGAAKTSQADVISGTNGRDTLLGGRGEDTFWASKKNDHIDGGSAWDEVVYAHEKSSIEANLKYGWVRGESIGEDTLVSIESIVGTRYHDRMIGGNKDDYFAGLKGNDTMKGGKGSDHVRYNNEHEFGGKNGIKADLEKGKVKNTFGKTDRLDSIENVDGSVFDDKINGNDDANRLRGREGDDRLNGENGKDALYGGEGNDTVKGGGGKDTLYGESGKDSLYGNGGDDVFVFSDGFGKDRIYDFDAKSKGEKIDLSDVSSITSFRDLEKNHLTQDGDDLEISAGGSHRITLIDVDLRHIDASDFLF